MDREMKRMMGVLGACWIGALGLVVTGVLLAVLGGSDAVRMFVLVLLGASVANVMLLVLIRLYTRLRCDLPIVGGMGMALGCALLLIPSTSELPGNGFESDGLDHARVVRALPGDDVRGPVAEAVLVDTTPGGYYRVLD